VFGHWEHGRPSDRATDVTPTGSQVDRKRPREADPTNGKRDERRRAELIAGDGSERARHEAGQYADEARRVEPMPFVV